MSRQARRRSSYGEVRKYMKPIKTIAGKVLLYFYFVQRTDTAQLFDTALNFQMRDSSSRQEEMPILGRKDAKIQKNLLKITDNANNLYNALKYLEDKGFIGMKSSPDRTNDLFFEFRVLSDGVDAIEAILRGEKEKQEFYTTFNIKLADKIDIEGLLEKQLGSIYK